MQTAAPNILLYIIFERSVLQQEKAQAEGNGSKARRMGRVITQCQDVIKAVKLKRPVDFNSLPELPGAEPIPLPPYMSGLSFCVRCFDFFD